MWYLYGTYIIPFNCINNEKINAMLENFLKEDKINLKKGFWRLKCTNFQNKNIDNIVIKGRRIFKSELKNKLEQLGFELDVYMFTSLTKLYGTFTILLKCGKKIKVQWTQKIKEVKDV